MKNFLSLILISIGVLVSEIGHTCAWDNLNCPPGYTCKGLQWGSGNPGRCEFVYNKISHDRNVDIRSEQEFEHEDGDSWCLNKCGRSCLEKPIFCGSW
jgi:hypothetical protein